ncbi:uncharacterized protein LOC129607249 [Condylostylus longicornis]|uniref:uncharacterized protein LOC129607249 n=1 Tax=Condylostylus longicornis TaxID=2530218 RepID=UPI00244DBCD3|nr:uncharacterized protein LOC129607249 [Condylostylus longicornis]
MADENVGNNISEIKSTFTPTAPLLCGKECETNIYHEQNKKLEQVQYTKPKHDQPSITPQPPIIIIKSPTNNEAAAKCCNCNNTKYKPANKVNKYEKFERFLKYFGLVSLVLVIVFFLWYIPYVILGNHWMFWKY